MVVVTDPPALAVGEEVAGCTAITAEAVRVVSATLDAVDVVATCSAVVPGGMFGEKAALGGMGGGT